MRQVTDAMYTGIAWAPLLVIVAGSVLTLATGILYLEALTPAPDLLLDS